jgi:hypothetical protein
MLYTLFSVHDEKGQNGGKLWIMKSPRWILYLEYVWTNHMAVCSSCSGLNCIPFPWPKKKKKPYIQALTPNVALFGDKAIKEVIEVKWCQKGRTLIQFDWCPYKKRWRHQGCVYREQVMWGLSKKGAICKPGRDTNSVDTLILNFQPREL